MSDATKLLETLTQYTVNDDTYFPAHQSCPSLPPNIYKFGYTMSGQLYLKEHKMQSDSMLKINNKGRLAMMAEFRKFWMQETIDKYHKLNYLHKRGFVYEGLPGTGKTSDLKLMMREMVDDCGGIVLLVDDCQGLSEAVTAIKQIEPTKPVAIVMDDFEKLGTYQENYLLELLDGAKSMDGVFFLATTNYIDQLSPRLLRKSRFDRVIHIDPPNQEDRCEYLKHKASGGLADEVIVKIAEKTAGKSYADLKDIIVSLMCFDYSVDDVLSGHKVSIENRNESHAKRWLREHNINE